MIDGVARRDRRVRTGASGVNMEKSDTGSSFVATGGAAGFFDAVDFVEDVRDVLVPLLEVDFVLLAREVLVVLLPLLLFVELLRDVEELRLLLAELVADFPTLFRSRFALLVTD